MKRVGHDGSQEKTRTCLLLDPKTKNGVAVMTNPEWANVTRLATILMDEVE